MKKFLLTLSSVVLVFLMCISSVSAEEELTNKIINKRISPAPTNLRDSNLISKEDFSKYTFALGNSSKKPGKITGADLDPVTDDVKAKWTELYGKELGGQFYDGPPALATGKIKEKYSAYYEKVGTYNNRLIDVKATVMNFDVRTPTSENDKPFINLRPGTISFPHMVAGVKWVEIKYEFFYSDDKKPAEVYGYTTYWDVDGDQGIILHDNNDGLYITDSTKNNNVLRVAEIDNQKYIFDNTYSSKETTPSAEYDERIGVTPDSNFDVRYAFGEIFHGTSITRTFTYGQPNGKNGGETTWFGYCMGGMTLRDDALLPQDIEPEKEVDKKEVGLKEEFTYTITQKVPMLTDKFKYENFSVIDTLAAPLYVNENNIKVLDENDNDVTSLFNTTITDQTIEIKLNNDKAADFYGHTYRFMITTYIKDNADLSKYKEGNKYVIPNQAIVKYNRANEDPVEKPTKEVKVTYTPEIAKVPDTGANISKIGIALGFTLIIGSVGVIIYTSKKNKKAIR